MSKVMGMIVTLAMLGGASAVAQPVLAAQGAQAAAPQPVAALPSADVTTGQATAWALNIPQQKPAVAVPQISQEPKKLPLADFGQWDEAASEN